MASQIGEAVIKLTFDGNSVKASLNKVESTVESSGKKAGSKWGGTWAVAAGNLIAKGVSKVAGMVTNTMGSAINRLDTLSNFPKVMTALGYSAEEADKSINTMSDSLDGLPTSLDAMANDVQKLAATMGNLAEGEVNATSVGLGLNDMFLAGGRGTEAASRAMEQYNQMLANGKVDMQSWRSIVNAAPGQLDQLAKSLVGATANQADLYEALQSGKVSFEELNAEIVKLDQEGGEGFASFNAQAVAATQGIATQIQNLSSTMNKIVAAALDGNMESMDKYMKQLGDRVMALVPTLVQGFTGAFEVLLTNLPEILLELTPIVMDAIIQLTNTVIAAIPQMLQTIFEIIMAIAQALIDNLPIILDTITTVIIQIANLLTDPTNLQWLLSSAIELLLAIVRAIPTIIQRLAEALPQIIENIIAFLTDPATIQMLIEAAIQLFFALVLAVPQILGSLIGAFGSLVGNLWNGIKNMFGQFAANFGKFITDIFKGAINGMISFIENFINVPINLINGFLDIINAAFGWLGVNIGHVDLIHLPRLAVGGVVNSATTAIIGEDGQEAVLPLENNTGNWAGLLAETLATEMKEQGTGGAGVTVYMTNEINNRLDAEEIGRVMVQSIRRAV